MNDSDDCSQYLGRGLLPSEQGEEVFDHEEFDDGLNDTKERLLQVRVMMMVMMKIHLLKNVVQFE